MLYFLLFYYITYFMSVQTPSIINSHIYSVDLVYIVYIAYVAASYHKIMLNFEFWCSRIVNYN